MAFAAAMLVENLQVKCESIIQSSSSPGCHLRATSEYPVIALPLPMTPTLPSSEVANMLVFFIPLEMVPATATCASVMHFPAKSAK
jgi:hypothetical protein